MLRKILLFTFLSSLFVSATTLLTTSCSKTVKTTQVLVQDSIRHYYPLVQGTDLTLVWRVANTGDRPLVITDIQPSCGCIIEDGEQEKVVAPGKVIPLRFIFRSDKNSGYVRHTIRLFGNMNDVGMSCLTFDLNVVAPALGSPDYEELHKNRSELESYTTTPTISDETKRDYWIDINDYPNGYDNSYWKEKY